MCCPTATRTVNFMAYYSILHNLAMRDSMPFIFHGHMLSHRIRYGMLLKIKRDYFIVLNIRDDIYSTQTNQNRSPPLIIAKVCFQISKGMLDFMYLAKKFLR